jgi:CTP:molybdopterin cytidylyltransferase MocA
MTVPGLLLAAGAGRRMGGPKALLRHPDGVTWVARAARVLREGGCDPLLVVVGARADAVEADVMASGVDRISVVRAVGWAEGMGASLRAGLEAVAQGPGAAVVISLVDTQGVTADVVRRLCAATRAQAQAEPAADGGVLARASYHGVPGHPVLIGRGHWPGVRAVALGDSGARAYLAAHRVTLIECADVGSGVDLDTPAPPG